MMQYRSLVDCWAFLITNVDRSVRGERVSPQSAGSQVLYGAALLLNQEYAPTLQLAIFYGVHASEMREFRWFNCRLLRKIGIGRGRQFQQDQDIEEPVF